MRSENTITIDADKQIKITNLLAETSKEQIIELIISGLSKHTKQISPVFFYDDVGSELFKQITELPEYYPSRTEKQILGDVAKGLNLGNTPMDIVELGSGDCSKISIILSALSLEQRSNIRYIPVDVSESAMLESANELRKKFPKLDVYGLVLDFTTQLSAINGEKPQLFCFLGSTIGNFIPSESLNLLKEIRLGMKPEDRLLLGFDLVKSTDVLNNAYNDKKGTTALFNLNILNVVNSYLGSNFNLDNYEHLAFFNEEQSRIEMHLVAKNKHQVIGESMVSTLDIEAGEHIITEYSYKYSFKQINDIASKAGLTMVEHYTDEKEWFGMGLFKPV